MSNRTIIVPHYGEVSVEEYKKNSILYDSAFGKQTLCLSELNDMQSKLGIVSPQLLSRWDLTPGVITLPLFVQLTGVHYLAGYPNMVITQTDDDTISNLPQVTNTAMKELFEMGSDVFFKLLHFWDWNRYTTLGKAGMTMTQYVSKCIISGKYINPIVESKYRASEDYVLRGNRITLDLVDCANYLQRNVTESIFIKVANGDVSTLHMHRAHNRDPLWTTRMMDICVGLGDYEPAKLFEIARLCNLEATIEYVNDNPDKFNQYTLNKVADNYVGDVDPTHTNLQLIIHSKSIKTKVSLTELSLREYEPNKILYDWIVSGDDFNNCNAAFQLTLVVLFDQSLPNVILTNLHNKETKELYLLHKEKLNSHGVYLNAMFGIEPISDEEIHSEVKFLLSQKQDLRLIDWNESITNRFAELYPVIEPHHEITMDDINAGFTAITQTDCHIGVAFCSIYGNNGMIAQKSIPEFIKWMNNSEYMGETIPHNITAKLLDIPTTELPSMWNQLNDVARMILIRLAITGHHKRTDEYREHVIGTLYNEDQVLELIELHSWGNDTGWLYEML